MARDTANRPGLTGLGARVHLFVRPESRERFIALFRDVLDCSVAELDFGMGRPIMLVRFGDGSSFSVETSELAPAEPADRGVDRRHGSSRRLDRIPDGRPGRIYETTCRGWNSPVPTSREQPHLLQRTGRTGVQASRRRVCRAVGLPAHCGGTRRRPAAIQFASPQRRLPAATAQYWPKAAASDRACFRFAAGSLPWPAAAG